ncbi:MAG: hypothetical protein CML20_20095 [Rheinheimera sp.]|nr:hypothetical protein [Rheinheimera sp.]
MFGVIVFLFPLPQLRERFKITAEKKAQLRQNAKKASAKGLNWWTSPFPWALLIVLAVIFVN